MPLRTLIALLDDIASVLDDVAAMTKVAAQQTAGVLGDDLALNAQQVAGVAADRELPVVWAVAKGSALNKAILVPLALLVSALAPWAVTPLLMLGGAYLCFEGCEKLAHGRGHAKDQPRPAQPAPTDVKALERAKIRGAVRTDFILSAEIVVISLGTVAAAPFVTRVLVLIAVALAMTAGVYGVVAGIVKLDDVGLYLSRKRGGLARGLGAGIVRVAPLLMRALSVVGTAAMFLVGGGILLHGTHVLQPWVDGVARHASTVPGVGGVLGWAVPVIANGLAGVLAGALVLVVVTAVQRVAKRISARR
jgi:predicted DNA repair protein MutK